jgi:hypothetical protein
MSAICQTACLHPNGLKPWMYCEKQWHRACFNCSQRLALSSLFFNMGHKSQLYHDSIHVFVLYNMSLNIHCPLPYISHSLNPFVLASVLLIRATNGTDIWLITTLINSWYKVFSHIWWLVAARIIYVLWDKTFTSCSSCLESVLILMANCLLMGLPKIGTLLYALINIISEGLKTEKTPKILTERNNYNRKSISGGKYFLLKTWLGTGHLL